MSDLWKNDYSSAGKGAKARQRERLNMKTIPKKLATTRTKPKNRPKAYVQKPELERKKKQEQSESQAFHSAIGIKARIRLLVIDRDASYLDICETLKNTVSGVTIGNLRRDMIEIMKLLEKEGLLNVDALAKRRRNVKAGKSV
jgi:hypothetical protein